MGLSKKGLLLFGLTTASASLLACSPKSFTAADNAPIFAQSATPGTNTGQGNSNQDPPATTTVQTLPGQPGAEGDDDARATVNTRQGGESTARTTATAVDPLMIDFGSNGILLSSQEAGIYFDMKGDGTKDKFSWPLTRGNMFLVHDMTSAGGISGQELFGNYTVGPDGHVAPDGFAALSKYDRNFDGKIDRDDAIFSELRFWEDSERDGVVQAGELHTLSEMGVKSIELNYTISNEVDLFGNETRMRAVVHMEGRPNLSVSDIWFKPAN